MGNVRLPPVILLAGPTATGKTALAVELARRLDGEIVSADSMQIYRGCAIGTAQPSPMDLQGIPCHLVGCVEPDQPWSVADWLRATRRIVGEIQARGRAVLVAGGTGLYFKAFTDGLFEAQGAGRHADVRRQLEAQWDADGGLSLRRRLHEVDPVAAARIHANDRLRVVRALEVYATTGRPVSLLQAEARCRHESAPARRFVLCASREELYRRINLRVEEMMEKGFAEEASALLRRGACEDWPAMRALGYPQMLKLARGELSRDQAVEQTQRLTRRYAKQQIVLLRKWPGAVWLDTAAGTRENSENIEIILEFSPAGSV